MCCSGCFPLERGRWRGGITTKASLVAVQISAEGSQCFGEGSGSFSQTTNPTTWDGKSCSGRVELRLRLFRFTSGLVAELISSGRVHGSSIQLVFPLSPPRWSLLGVGVLTCFGVHHLVRVMPGRKSSLGRLRGRAFGRESRSRRGERGGAAACCPPHPRGQPAWHDVPRLEEALELRRGFGASWVMWL